MNRFLSLALVSMGLWLPTVAYAEDLTPPQIVHEPCEAYQTGKAFKILARFYDESPIFDPKVVYRVRGDTTWKTATFSRSSRGDDFQAIIQRRQLKGPVEYFIETFDENGNGPARYGSPEAPVRVKPSKDPTSCQQLPETGTTVIRTTDASNQPEAAGAPPALSDTPSGRLSRPASRTALDMPPPPPATTGCDSANPPLYCSGWLWGTVGAVVIAGAGVGAYMLLQPDSKACENCTDTVTLNIEFAPDPTGTIQ